MTPELRSGTQGDGGVAELGSGDGTRENQRPRDWLRATHMTDVRGHSSMWFSQRRDCFSIEQSFPPCKAQTPPGNLKEPLFVASPKPCSLISFPHLGWCTPLSVPAT